MSCTTVTFKRGTSFAASCAYTPSVGAPANLLGTTVTSTIVDSNLSPYDLVVTIANDGLSFTAVYAGDTSSWSTGMASWDIRFSLGGSVFYTVTMRLNVIGQVTIS
jgi:hypothetical protein